MNLTGMSYQDREMSALSASANNGILIMLILNGKREYWHMSKNNLNVIQKLYIMISFTQ